MNRSLDNPLKKIQLEYSQYHSILQKPHEKLMLIPRLHIQPPSHPEPEYIFQSWLPALFSHDTLNSHGNSGDVLIYQSPYYGDIKIYLPLHPDQDARRQPFAHYLWNAGVLLADMIEQASYRDGNAMECGSPDPKQDFWNVRGESVLEIGAGW